MPGTIAANKSPQLFDMVAVTTPQSDTPLVPGDVGTVVEILPPDAFEVEFLDRTGHTRCIETLLESDILVLNRERASLGNPPDPPPLGYATP